MRVKLVEVTNNNLNWGKFLLGRFDDEWSYKSVVDGNSIIAGRGWSQDNILVLDLQTGEGSIFRPGGLAQADLEKHRIWVCPMFEPFLVWLYQQPDPFAIPALVNLPEAKFEMSGYRRPGPTDKLLGWNTLRLTEKQRQCLEYVAQGERPPFKRTTVQSLAKHGLVELQKGVGWRVTQNGVDWLDAYKIEHGDEQ